ncbi:MAG: hypothetical protein HOV83_03110 [Catenulispora sp.]|nr:hypothetical protein [Catenulispora sp.]
MGRGAVWRLRSGVGLFVLSWVPFAQLYIWLAGLSGEAADKVRVSVWTVQYLVGFLGLALAGTAAKTAVRAAGWKRLPATMWRMLWTGRLPGSS